jgi:hypothetical protein
MKKTLLSCALLLVITALSSAADWQAEYARLLKKYVTPSGVRYAAWKANAEDVAAMKSVVDGIAAAPASSAKSKEQLAFHINAYNAWIINEVLEKYPTKSVKDALYTFFTAKRLTVAGEKMSFNHLEKNVIIPRFSEPRIHFALNCASRSCPPLRDEPYAGGKVDAQLEQVARAFVNTSRGVAINKDTAALSKIFEWYKDDFGGESGAVAFINKRRPAPLPPKITYQEYDWALNEAK